jgi:hypothetical protein
MSKRRTEADRNYDRFVALRSRLIGLTRQAIAEHWTHENLLAEEQRLIFTVPAFHKLTQVDRARLREVRSVWRDRINQELVIWRLGPESGPLPETAHGIHDWPEGGELSTLCRQPGKLYGAHFWRGTDQPWGEWKATN